MHPIAINYVPHFCFNNLAGSGKSGMITFLPYYLRASRVLVLTPSHVISDQIAEAFGNKGKDKSFFHKCGLLTAEPYLKSKIESCIIIDKTKEIYEIKDEKVVIINAQKFAGNSKANLNKFENGECRNFLRSFDCVIIDEAHHLPSQTWKNIVQCCTGKIAFLTATPYRMVGKSRIDITNICPELKKVYEVRRQKLEGE